VRGIVAAVVLALLPSSLFAADPAEEGRLRVVLVAGWGEVKVDGQWRGLAPVELALPAGRHRVEVPETTSHLAWTKDVEVPSGDQVTVYVERPHRTSVVVLEGFPPHAEVRVNGLDLGPVASRPEVRIAVDGTYDLDILLDGTIVASRRVVRCDEAPCLLPGAMERFVNVDAARATGPDGAR